MAVPRPTIVVQLSDPHVTVPGARLLGRIDTGTMLRDAVSHVNGLDPRPDLAVVTGDLTAEGHLDEYRHLATLLRALHVPSVVVPGNHDDRAALARVLPRPEPWPGDEVGWQQAVRVGPLRLLLLDSQVPGSPGGRLGPARLAWLERQLAGSGDPTVLAVHHPPYATGMRHMDTMRLEDGGALGDVVARHPHVVRIVTGHVHRAVAVGWRGTVVTTCPSTAHQVVLDLTEGEARWRREPPAVQLHVWLPEAEGGAGSLVTHTSPIGDHGPGEGFGSY
jgi:3',5'-cyclic-AMP phosphodiesterase